MYFGRIITRSNRVDTVDYVNITKDIASIDQSIPTLIVGKKLAIDTFGKDNIHFFDKKVKDNVYWTYSRLERRDVYEGDIEKFNYKIINTIKSSVRYTSYSFMTSSLKRVRDMMRYLSYGDRKYIYLSGKHIYVYSNGGLVFGISMNETDYLGIDRDRIKKFLSRNGNVIISRTDFISPETRKSISEPYMIPYLYSIRNN